MDEPLTRAAGDPVKARKAAIRQQVWQRLEAERLATFPRPVHGRIPNFKGAELAAAHLAAQPEFRQARSLKVNPDAPQRAVRRLALQAGKLLLMPTPRLHDGFLLLDPARLPADRLTRASSISGAFELGERIGLGQLPRLDLIVVGAVAVSPGGARLGKGEGYGELEYAVLRQLGLIDERVPVWTTVHDVQVVDDIPVEPFDVPVDVIVTPTRLLRIASPLPKPDRLFWDRLEPRRLEEMPVLRELAEMDHRRLE